MFTHREKHLLIAIGIWFILMVFFPAIRPENHPNMEIPFLLFIVAPAGLYMLTDPERYHYIKRK